MTQGRATLALLATLTLIGALGCRAVGSGAASPSASQRRALLLRPEDAYWRQAAPARFQVSVATTKGAFVIEVERALAPRGVDRFYALVQAGYFDDSRFFRVVPAFIAQFGIPGDPAVAQVWRHRAIDDDSTRTSNVRGTVAYAMTGPNTRTTQLFVSLADNSRLDTQGFAPIGRVISGMDVVDRLYGGYGESAGGGMRAGNQRRMFEEGNAHLDHDYPLLDRIIRMTATR